MQTPNNNAAYFAQVISKYKELRLRARDIVGAIAIELFNEGFAKQGQIMRNGTVKPWAKRSFNPPSYGSHPVLVKRGHLRRANRYVKKGKNIVELRNHKPYATLHNDGGVIKVTPKMRRFFWAMVYKYWQKGITYSIATRQLNNRKKDQRYGPEAEFWLKMALAKQITIPKRPIFYDTPELSRRLDVYFIKAVKEILK